MKNMYVIIGIVAVLIVGGVGLSVLSGGDAATDQQNNVSQASSTNPDESVAIEQLTEDAELMRFVEKDSIEYKNALSFTGEEYDQYFIANMIHYSEGLAQLEVLAAKSTNPRTSEGALERSKQAEADAEMYRRLQKDMGQPISYGNAMQYHAAMGADTEVYFSVSSLEGLSGDAFESKIIEQLKYIRRAETLLSGAGINNADDEKVHSLIRKTLEANALILERI
jgi:hypothetical protein